MIKNFVVVGGQGEVHKTLFLLFSFFFLLYLENRGGGNVAAAAKLATGTDSMSGEYLGRGMPWGTTNPS